MALKPDQNDASTSAADAPQDAPEIAAARLYRRTIAGSEANVAVALTRLGFRARYLTVVGSDGLGDAVEHDLRASGVDAVVGRSDRSTGVLIRESAGRRAPAQAVNLRLASAATDLSPALVDAAWQPGPRAVFVTGITAVRSESARAAVLRTVEKGRAEDALIVVDPNFRPRLASADDFRDALAGLRGRIDVAVGDLDELALLTDSDPSDAVSALLANGCRRVIVKSGADGAVGYDDGAMIHVASRASVVSDTVGAGDAFAGGVIAGLLNGRTMADCLELGAVVAARVVGTEGDIEGLPTAAELSHDLEGRQ